MEKVGNNVSTFVAHGGNVKCLSFGKKTRTLIATGGDDRHVNIWQIGKPNYLHHLSGSSSSVEAVAFEGEEKTVVGGSATGSLKLWDLATGKLVRSLTGHKANIRSVDFHPYGDFIASGSLDTVLKVWDIRRKGCIQQYKGHSDAINAIRFSPDGRWVISGSEDCVVKLWDLTAGKMIKELKDHRGAITSLEFHPNEFLLATGSADRTVKWWDLETFNCVSASDAEASPIRSVAFDEGGLSLYSVAQDSLRVHGWEPWTCYDRKALPWGKVQEVMVSGDKLVTGSINQQQVSVWEVPLSKLNRSGDGLPPATPTSAPPPYDVDPPQSQQPVAPAAVPAPTHTAPPAAALQAAAVRSGADERPLPTMATQPPVRTPAAAAPSTAKTPAGRDGGEASGGPGGAGTPVIPAQRDKPVGLNLDAFLPASAAPETDRGAGDAEVLDSIETGHASMVKVLQLRLRNTQIVRTRWESGDYAAAVDTLIGLADQAVLVDVLNIMVQKSKLWSLELSATLLPQVVGLLGSMYESYVLTGVSTVQLVVKLFGQIVIDNIRSPPAANGVDITREERYDRCMAVHHALRTVRKAIAPRVGEPGKIGSQLRALDKLLSAHD